MQDGTAERDVFQSTSLSRGKTQHWRFRFYHCNLSIHFPLTREDNASPETMASNILSIHFPLTREDDVSTIHLSFDDLSIHFPLTREDLCVSRRVRRDIFFQSTSLSRGKTLFVFTVNLVSDLSIHFPLTREDSCGELLSELRFSFNPLPSHEGRLFDYEKWNLLLPFNPLPSHEGRPYRVQITA